MVHRALPLLILASLVVFGCTSPPPGTPRASSSLEPPATASIGTSAELKRAECEFLARALGDARQLQSLGSPFSAEDRALAGAIYGRTNASLDNVGRLVQDASRSSGLDDSVTEAFLSLASIGSQISAASIAVDPGLRSSVHLASPDLVLADLGLAIQTIGSASQELGCS
jgi:hypothetical protein